VKVEMALDVAENRVVHSVGPRGSLQSTCNVLRIADEGNRLPFVERGEVVDVPIERKQAPAGKPSIVVEPQRRGGKTRERMPQSEPALRALV
jgi:hypothetical protein